MEITRFFYQWTDFPGRAAAAKTHECAHSAKESLIRFTLASPDEDAIELAIIIATSLTNKTAVALDLAIGMSLHWPTIGWLYGSRTSLLHAPVRAALVSICWFSLPDSPYTVLPFMVAGVYLVSVWGLKREVALARQRTLMENVNPDHQGI